MNYSMWFKWKW